jgi:hypothetical protein
MSLLAPEPVSGRERGVPVPHLLIQGSFGPACHTGATRMTSLPPLLPHRLGFTAAGVQYRTSNAPHTFQLRDRKTQNTTNCDIFMSNSTLLFTTVTNPESESFRI